MIFMLTLSHESSMGCNFLPNYCNGPIISIYRFPLTKIAQGTSVQGRDRGPSHKQSLDSIGLGIQPGPTLSPPT